MDVLAFAMKHNWRSGILITAVLKKKVLCALIFATSTICFSNSTAYNWSLSAHAVIEQDWLIRPVFSKYKLENIKKGSQVMVILLLT